ncbi:MAG TPA: RNA-binding protein [Bacillales bacterium]|nr:RNA-binding protein [Bacillales bacterium]
MDLYQHFRPEEKPFIDEITGWVEEVQTRYVPKRSDFLDPRQQDIVRAVIGDQDDISMSFSGGSENAERKRLLLLPPYSQSEDEDHGLTLFEVNYPRKFASIGHRDLLGALMGIGLKREKFGDLLFQDGQVQFVVAKEIASYVRLNLTEVGSSPVELEEIPIQEILVVPESWSEQGGTVSSLRLDAVLSEVYRLSRAKITPLIRKGFVKVNWKTVEQPSYSLRTGDYLSFRGKGRSKLLGVEGPTKKGKQRIIIGKPDENHP